MYLEFRQIQPPGMSRVNKHFSFNIGWCWNSPEGQDKIVVLPVCNLPFPYEAVLFVRTGLLASSEHWNIPNLRMEDSFKVFVKLSVITNYKNDQASSSISPVLSNMTT